MKKMLTTILLGLPFLIQPLAAQSSEENFNFYLENNSIEYRNVFEVENTSSNEIIEKLKKHLATASGFNNIEFDGTIYTGQFVEHDVDYKKYGARQRDIFLQLQVPISGKFLIEVKDNRYRVIISDIKGYGHPFGEFQYSDLLTTKRREAISEKTIVLNGMNYMDRSFVEKFTLTLVGESDDW